MLVYWYQVTLRSQHGLAVALQHHIRPTGTDLYQLSSLAEPAWHGGPDLDQGRASVHALSRPGCTCGDQWVCPECGQWHRYGGGFASRKAPQALVELPPGSRSDGGGKRYLGGSALGVDSDLKALILPVLDELARKGQLKADDELRPDEGGSFSSIVCAGCGTKYGVPPLPPPCPFIAREEYFRGVGMLAGACIKNKIAGTKGRGSDVMIKIQVGAQL